MGNGTKSGCLQLSFCFCMDGYHDEVGNVPSLILWLCWIHLLGISGKNMSFNINILHSKPDRVRDAKIKTGTDIATWSLVYANIKALSK